jgi:hypothetical protein
MKTAAEYRAMADECFKWAREARTKEVRKSYLQLAQIWLNTASCAFSRQGIQFLRSGNSRHKADDHRNSNRLLKLQPPEAGP